MKRLFFPILLFTLIPIMSLAQTKVNLTVGDKTVTATLADNSACRELITLLEKGSISILMSEYGGFEKVGSLPQSFTTSNSQITTKPGDIMLYQGNQMVIFYGTNSWSYTRFGRIDNATAESVREFLGNGNITLTISLPSQSGITEIKNDEETAAEVYNLNGQIVKTRPLIPGIYIVNGKKKLIK